MESIDRKFKIIATSVVKGNVYTDEEGVFFKAADAAFDRDVMDAYKRAAIKLGAAQRQILGIELLTERIERYKAKHPQLVKVPDVDVGEEEMIVNRPNE